MNDDNKEKHNTKDFKYCFFDSLNLLLTYSSLRIRSRIYESFKNICLRIISLDI